MKTLAAGVRPANPASPENTQPWHAALTAYLAAKSAEDAYDRDFYMPAFNRWSAAINLHGQANVPASDHIPDDVETEIERLQGLRHDAEDVIMAIPSPDPTAFARKFLVAHGEDRGGAGWDELLEAEAKHFVGEA